MRCFVYFILEAYIYSFMVENQFYFFWCFVLNTSIFIIIYCSHSSALIYSLCFINFLSPPPLKEESPFNTFSLLFQKIILIKLLCCFLDLSNNEIDPVFFPLNITQRMLFCFCCFCSFLAWLLLSFDCNLGLMSG